MLLYVYKSVSYGSSPFTQTLWIQHSLNNEESFRIYKCSSFRTHTRKLEKVCKNVSNENLNTHYGPFAVSSWYRADQRRVTAPMSGPEKAFYSIPDQKY